ncbi:MAG: hypothetical protein QMC46_08305 [Burkholderiaceae bacterium]
MQIGHLQAGGRAVAVNAGQPALGKLISALSQSLGIGNVRGTAAAW